MTLAELKLDQTGVICAVEGTDAVSMRLLELGFYHGQVIRRTGQAPSGDPLEYAIAGSRIGLRKSEALRVHIDEQ